MVGDAHVQANMRNSTHAYIHARTHASTDASTHVCTHVDCEGVVKGVEWRCGVWRYPGVGKAVGGGRSGKVAEWWRQW